MGVHVDEARGHDLARGLDHLRTIEATLLLLIEPVTAGIWAWLVHGDPLGIAHGARFEEWRAEERRRWSGRHAALWNSGPRSLRLAGGENSHPLACKP